MTMAGSSHGTWGLVTTPIWKAVRSRTGWGIVAWNQWTCFPLVNSDKQLFRLMEPSVSLSTVLPDEEQGRSSPSLTVLSTRIPEIWKCTRSKYQRLGYCHYGLETDRFTSYFKLFCLSQTLEPDVIFTLYLCIRDIFITGHHIKLEYIINTGEFLWMRNNTFNILRASTALLPVVVLKYS